MKATDKKYIIRTDRAGVFYAGIKERRGSEADLTDARRIHYWRGATECIGIAQSGVGDGSKVTVSVPAMTVLGVIEVISVSASARKKLEAQKEWKI